MRASYLCVAFAAPQAGPGKGEVQVTQAGKTESYPVEAVATRIARDCPDANVGDIRVLSLTLVGAWGAVATACASASTRLKPPQFLQRIAKHGVTRIELQTLFGQGDRAGDVAELA